MYTTLTCLVGSSFRRKRPCLTYYAVFTLILCSISYGTYDDLGLSAPPKISPAGLEGIRSRVVARGPVKEEHRTYHILSDLSSRISPVTRPLSKGCLLSGAPQPDHVSAKLRKCPSQRPPTSQPPSTSHGLVNLRPWIYTGLSPADVPMDPFGHPRI